MGKYKPGSIFSLFNKVKTRGGERWLEDLFRHPLTRPSAINERSALFEYFGKSEAELPFSSGLFEIAEGYLSTGTSSNSIAARAYILRKKIEASVLRDEEYEKLVQGFVASIEVLKNVKFLVDSLDIPQFLECKEILSDKRLRRILQEPAIFSAGTDALIRGKLYEEMQVVLDTIYQLDVFIAVSRVARERGFSYAKALEQTDGPVFDAPELRHPALDKAVANPFSLHGDKNLLFLTGANMAGKSTLMKSAGIAFYLAHMGFPVAAGRMSFSVLDGLFCSINVADNLLQGYSHYYAEVLRVKQVAARVAGGKRLLVIFDELFKGTNVRDAYEATLACTKAFARYRRCLFVVSTHIIEVAEELKAEDNIVFSYMPTVMQGHTPMYPYTLSSGVTEDRQGMIIIENEGILQMLKRTAVTD
ncbi:MAG: DNA mismatch repair protein [Bacteroidetes bacterium]|nr:DNA mismatch repair protein [Bacteroidota bacterium]